MNFFRWFFSDPQPKQEPEPFKPLYTPAENIFITDKDVYTNYIPLLKEFQDEVITNAYRFDDFKFIVRSPRTGFRNSTITKTSLETEVNEFQTKILLDFDIHIDTEIEGSKESTYYDLFIVYFNKRPIPHKNILSVFKICDWKVGDILVDSFKKEYRTNRRHKIEAFDLEKEVIYVQIEDPCSEDKPNPKYEEFQIRFAGNRYSNISLEDRKDQSRQDSIKEKIEKLKDINYSC